MKNHPERMTRHLRSRVTIATNLTDMTDLLPAADILDGIRSPGKDTACVQAENARGDQCEACGKLVDPALLVQPRSVITGAAAELRDTVHWFLRLPDFEDRLRAQEGVPTDGPAAVGRFQQEAGCRPLVGGDQPAVGQHGRNLVAHHPLGQRDQVAALGQSAKSGQIRRGHGR